jgi:hypothetical protein
MGPEGDNHFGDLRNDAANEPKRLTEAKPSINESSVQLEPISLAPHLKVVSPTRSAHIYERVE